MIREIVYVFLISPPLPGLADTNCHHQTTRTLCGYRRTREGDDEHLRLFSEILSNVRKEAAFNALRANLPFMWDNKEYYDTFNPFGDDRVWEYHALWTFDTQNDMLYYTDDHSRRKVSMTILRERVVNLADMESLGGPYPSPLQPQIDLDAPYWKPRATVTPRMRAFAHRLLRDFHHQWRHILRNAYNFVTLRVLARAIISLSTLDFEIRQNTGGHGRRGLHVWVTHLPAWEPFTADIVRVGKIWVVLCQEIQEGLSMARQHVSSETFCATGLPMTTDPQEVQAHYMILSVKHIMLCRVTGADSLEHTAPEPLFNGDYGTEYPSELALDYLIWATTSARPSILTAAQLLPIEIQDMILNYVSIGTVEAAKVGCLLGLGSPFSWTDGLLKVKLAERYYVRPRGMPVESEIWFGEHKSAIVYLARPG